MSDTHLPSSSTPSSPTPSSPPPSSKPSSKQASKSAAAPQSPPPLPQLIVGLGNPGAKYDGTRHNIGFVVIDAIARINNIPLVEQKKFQGWYGEGQLGGHKVRLLKPNTYMNNSGQAIRAVLDWYKIPPEAVLVVYDDMDLPIGRLRLRLSGSAGGQNGMKSAIAHLGTQTFPRLRLGIGNKANKDAINHVLGSFTPTEKAIVTEVVDLAASAVAVAVKDGVEQSMNRYNNQIIGDLT
jgi:peptidyl-tRNA hydrolase, PTH1 family